MLATIQEHYVNGRNMFVEYPDGFEQMVVGMGCFWGVERIFWKLDGVWVTSAGYAGGHDGAPNYRSVCSGRTGHAEVVHLVFDPKVISYAELLKTFFEYHDPTQKDRQGNDIGTQYRSCVYTYSTAQRAEVDSAIVRYTGAYGKPIATEVAPMGTYFAAEDSHQQYLAKNPQGYCMHGPTGVFCALPETAREPAE